MTRRKAPAVREEGPPDPVGALEDLRALTCEVEAMVHAVVTAGQALPDGPIVSRMRTLLGITERLAEEAEATAEKWLERTTRGIQGRPDHARSGRGFEAARVRRRGF